VSIRRFVASTNREVMRLVRMALGPDALIVSSRTVDGGVEVIATDADTFDEQGAAPAAMPAVPPAPSAVAAAYAAASAATPVVAPSGEGAAVAAIAPAASVATTARAATVAPVTAAAASAPAASSTSDASSIPIAPSIPAASTATAAAGAPAAARTMPSLSAGPVASAQQPARAGYLPAELADALTDLRGALESRLDALAWSKSERRTPVAMALFRLLLGAGFSTALVRAMLERLPPELDGEGARAWARNELVTHLPVLRHEDELLAEAGVLALVGPTGVGKTTTIAKLAARCVLRVGADQVALLTTDTYRIGAHEQLQIYGRLMGVPVYCVRDVPELRRVLHEVGDRRIVLIDNVGISQRDRYVAEQAAMLCAAGRPGRRLLVLNAASQGDTLDEVAHAYRTGGSEDVLGCIITKLDEASHIGAALDTAIRHRLKIHYVSHGQKVPEHLALPRAADLVDQALAGAQGTRALYAPSEADLAALCEVAQGGTGAPAQALQDPVRRRQLLISAIARPQPAASPTSAAFELDAALDWLAGDAGCALARQLWKRHGQGQPAMLDELLQASLAAVREAFPKACQRYLLAVHGREPFKGEGLPGGHLLACLLMSDRGAALAAPVQQLVLAQGVLSSCGDSSAQATCPAEAMLSRARWLAEGLPQLPMVHVMESGTAALWQSLSDAGIAWLARCPGGFRLVHEDCPTTLQAVAKSLPHAPVLGAASLSGLDQLAAGAGTALALWAADAPVALSLRGAPEPALRMISARLVNARTGETVTQLCGLSNLPAGDASASLLAGWLAMHEQAKGSFRQMVHAWAPLGQPDGVQALLCQAVTAGHIGAAAWHIGRSPEASGLRNPLTGLVGWDRKAPARVMPVALQRLFALLEIAGQDPGAGAA